ncbi:MAG: hypothetical protein PHG06_12370 [Parabacteroides sp.]|nr:hypothetical protein [Parabacteroides sp.]
MKFRINATDATAIKNKAGVVVECKWNGYQDSCKRCSVKCPVRQ